MFPVEVQSVHGVDQRLVAHRNLAGKGLLIQVHECTAHLEIGGEIIHPVHTRHCLALHAELGVALQLYAYAGTRINNALVDDGHGTHAVIHGIVAVFDQSRASGSHCDRSARDVDRSQLYHVAVGARILAYKHELVLVGNSFGYHTRGVVQLLEYILVGHGIIGYHFTQMASERFHHREDDLSVRCLNRVSVYEIKPAVGVGVVLVIQTVQIHDAKQGSVLESSLRDIGQTASRAVAVVVYVQSELSTLDIALGDGIDVLHHQVPCAASG